MWTYTYTIYGLRRSLIVIGSITEVKQRRARFIIGWVTAWDCQVLSTLVGLRERVYVHYKYLILSVRGSTLDVRI